MDVSTRWLPVDTCITGIFAATELVKPEEVLPWCSGETKELLGHIGLYGILGFFTARWLASRGNHGSLVVLVAAATICVSLGVCDELHQMFVLARTASAYDVGLDLLGGALGAFTQCTVLGVCQSGTQSLSRPAPGVDGSGELELTPLKTNIPLQEFLADFQGGMTDTEMIDKYRISPDQLQSIFKRLLDRQVIDPVAFEAWQIFGNNDVPLDIRKYPRSALETRPPIYEASNSENCGVIMDLSAHGLAVQGLRARFDQMMTLVVPRTEVTPFGPITFDVRCRWISANEACEYPVGGFYVVTVGTTNWDSICRLLVSYAKAQG